MTYKILSTRTTPDGVLFVTVDYSFNGEIYTSEIPISIPLNEQQVTDAIINHVKSEQWRREAIANLSNIVTSLPLNQEVVVE